MAIWFRPYTLSDLGRMVPGNMLEHLGIEFTAIGEDFLEGTLPVDSRTRQPAGLLHGGASVVLAETLGSVAAYLVVDPARYLCVGQEVNANHLRSVRSGHIIGTARPVHLGRTTQVWDIRIRDAQDRPVCISRLTMAILPQGRPEQFPSED